MWKEAIKEFFRGDFNYTKYWTRRHKLFDPSISRFKQAYYNYYINKINIKFGACITHCIKGKDNFMGPPILGHGILGIVISSDAYIGYNVYISHQVTIGASKGGAPTIGNNVYIGPGAKLFGEIHIGNNVRIGANCVVFSDIPDNATVVLDKPRVIIKKSDYNYIIRSNTDWKKRSWGKDGKIIVN